MSGYNIEWNLKSKNGNNRIRNDINVFEKQNAITEKLNNDVDAVNLKTYLDNSVIASTSNEIVIVQSQKLPVNHQLNTKQTTANEDTCDLIILKSGQEIRCKIYEVNVNDIKYKECNISNGPLFTKLKSELVMIKYSNGTNAIFNNEEVTTSTSQQPIKRGSQTVAFVLCLLVGVFGIHRFYLGHIGMGILYLLTAGLCGIGWLVDIIMICTGDLKPRNGDYLEKW